ncbi:hypothetical protein [Flindersiella endophytica]
MKRTGKLTTALAAAVVLAGGVTGCGVTNAEPPPGRALTSKERALLSDAEQILVQRCMSEAGFRVYLTDPPPQPSDLPYGNESVAFARKHGLGLGTVDLDSYRANHPNTLYLQRLSPKAQQAYGEALHGRRGTRELTIKLPTGYTVQQNPGGCTAQAQGQLYGGFERWFNVSTYVENLSPLYARKLEADQRFRKALNGWQRCMRERGHDAGSPDELRAQFTERKRAKADEIEAAAAEAECATKTRLVRIGEDLEQTYRRQVYQEHRDLIADYQALSVSALERARTITNTRQNH